jgi:lipopolysaccharide biosynthesis regulator YciM
MAEYGFLVQTIDISPNMESYTAEQTSKTMATGLNTLLQNTSKGLKTLSGEAEILSHSATRVGNHLVVSFLFRRQ